MLDVLVIGDFAAENIGCRWVASTQVLPPQAQRRVDEAWDRASAHPDINLFDGPMCRLEAWRAQAGELHLDVSLTSYRLFFGTNMANPQLADEFGPQVMSYPLGVSCLLLTRDRFLLLGRRNERVAYYPGRIHPFAGTLEPREPLDALAEVHRELDEELSLKPAALEQIRCMGLVEDRALRQPELIFAGDCLQTRAQLEAQLDEGEHAAAHAIPATHQALEQALHDPAPFTPVAVASLLLWGRRTFGEAWFAHHLARIGGSIVAR